jgi:hypothetical protein
MANPIAVGNLVLIDVSGTGDLVEYDGEGGYVQQIAPPPGGVGGADWFITQLGAFLLLVPKVAGDILRYTRSGEALDPLVSAHEFGAATIHMAQVDQDNRLIVLYEVADEPGTPRIKRFNPDGSLETDFGPMTLADGFAVSGNQVGAGISPDGTTVYLAAGQYVEGGDRHIPIVKITLDDDLGVAVVTDRWATAVSGTNSSPGGGASISGSALTVDPASGDVSVVVARRLWPAGTPGSTDLTNGSISVPAHGEITCLYTSTGGSDASLSAPAPGTTITALIVARWANELFNAFMWADGSTTVRAELRLEGATVASFTRNLTFGNNIFGGDWGTLLGEGPFTTHIVNLGDHAVLWQGNDWVITGSAGIPADESTVAYLLHTFDAEGQLISAIELYRAPWQLGTHQSFAGLPSQVGVDPTDGGCVWVSIPHDGVAEGTALVQVNLPEEIVTQVMADLFGDGIAHPNVPLLVYRPVEASIPQFTLTSQLGMLQSQPGNTQLGVPTRIRSRYGVQTSWQTNVGAQPADRKSWTDDLVALGVGRVRIVLEMPIKHGDYKTWRLFVARCSARGLRPLVVLNRPIADSVGAFPDEAGAIAADLNGIVWDFEIWNEPNSNQPLDAADWAALQVNAAAKIRARIPDAIIVSGGLLFLEGGIPSSVAWLNAVYDCLDANAGGARPWDALGVNIYFSGNDDLGDGQTINLPPPPPYISARSTLGAIHNEQVANDDLAPIWLTEFGDPRACGNERCSVGEPSEIVQANNLDVWYGMLESPEFDQIVGPLFWHSHHRIKDPGAPPDEDAYYGLLNDDVVLDSNERWKAWQRLATRLQSAG